MLLVLEPDIHIYNRYVLYTEEGAERTLSQKMLDMKLWPTFLLHNDLCGQFFRRASDADDWTLAEKLLEC